MIIKYDRATDAAHVKLSNKRTETKVPFCKRVTVEFDASNELRGFNLTGIADWIGKPVPDSEEERDRKILVSLLNEFAIHTCAPMGTAD